MTNEDIKKICDDLWKAEESNHHLIPDIVSQLGISPNDIPKIVAKIQRMAFTHGVTACLYMMELRDKQIQEFWNEVAKCLNLH